MVKKIYLQLIIFFIAVLLSFFYTKYIYKDDLNIQVEQNKDEKDIISNVLENIEYISKDQKGNIFKITSNKGSIDNFNDKITRMKDVKSEIKLKNNELITIISQKAIYDRETNNSFFYEGVEIKFNESFIISEKLEFLFDQNLMLISENVIYKGPNSKLKTDRIEISLDTKNIKILMNKKDDKVEVKVVN